MASTLRAAQTVATNIAALDRGFERTRVPYFEGGSSMKQWKQLAAHAKAPTSRKLANKVVIVLITILYCQNSEATILRGPRFDPRALFNAG